MYSVVVSIDRLPIENQKTASDFLQKICKTLYTIHFPDFFYMPIPVRTCKIGKIKFSFNVYSKGNQPVSSPMEKRSHRYLTDLGRDSPAICRPWEGFFHIFDGIEDDSDVQPPGIDKI
jgi:hypothetical protein